jgi:integrase/recombinase XerD
MPTRLSTTIKNITSIPNSSNSKLTSEFSEYMKANGKSEKYQNNNLKAVVSFAKFLGPDITFYDIQKKDQILAYLDTKIKSSDVDPDQKWITTWNDYLGRIKYFMRWLYNQNDDEKKRKEEPLVPTDWETPSFIRIKKKRTKRLSPYLETELWERDELNILYLVIVLVGKQQIESSKLCLKSSYSQE